MDFFLFLIILLIPARENVKVTNSDRSHNSYKENKTRSVANTDPWIHWRWDQVPRRRYAKWCPGRKVISNLNLNYTEIWETQGNRIEPCIWEVIFDKAIITNLEIDKVLLDEESVVTHVMGVGQELRTLRDKLQIYIKLNNQTVQIASFPKQLKLSRNFLTDTFYFWYLPYNKSGVSYTNLDPFLTHEKQVYITARFKVVAYRCSGQDFHKTTNGMCRDVCYINGTREQICTRKSLDSDQSKLKTTLIPVVDTLTELTSERGVFTSTSSVLESSLSRVPPGTPLSSLPGLVLSKSSSSSEQTSSVPYPASTSSDRGSSLPNIYTGPSSVESLPTSTLNYQTKYKNNVYDIEGNLNSHTTWKYQDTTVMNANTIGTKEIATSFSNTRLNKSDITSILGVTNTLVKYTLKNTMEPPTQAADHVTGQNTLHNKDRSTLTSITLALQTEEETTVTNNEGTTKNDYVSTNKYRSNDDKHTTNTTSTYDKLSPVLSFNRSSSIITDTMTSMLSTERAYPITSTRRHMGSSEDINSEAVPMPLHIVSAILGVLFLALLVAFIVLVVRFKRMKSKLNGSSQSSIVGDGNHLWRKNWIVNRKVDNFVERLDNTAVEHYQKHPQRSPTSSLLKDSLMQDQNDDKIYDNIAVSIGECENIKSDEEEETDNNRQEENHSITKSNITTNVALNDQSSSSYCPKVLYSKLERHDNYYEQTEIDGYSNNETTCL